jgi:regulator of replication initiation timing
MIVENLPPAQKSDLPPISQGFDMQPAIALRGAKSLRRLRDRVEAAVQEIKHLRQQNQKLAEQIAELESASNIKPTKAVLTFDENEQELLDRINKFIKTIDNYLVFDEEED